MYFSISILILTIVFLILVYKRFCSIEYFGVSPDLKIYSILLKELYIFKYFIGLGIILAISYAVTNNNNIILSFVWMFCVAINIIIVHLNEE